MAEIKVERKGPPWWLWVLLALLAVALVWWAIAAFGDEDGEAPATEAAAVGAPAATAPASAATDERALTDIATVLDADDPSALVGREVDLRGVRVLEMVGDATFWVGRGPDQRIFVILDEQIPSPPPEVEGRVNVNAGQMVDIKGVMRRGGDLPGGDVLDQRDRDALGDGPVYIWARNADVASRP
jgi:hypothetical protein